MEEKCPFHEMHEKRINDVEDYVENVDQRVIKLEKNTALDSQRFTMILENLSRLPEAIESIKESLVTMQEEIRKSNDKTDAMKTQLERLDEKVGQIDNEGKFNLRIFIKDHAVGVIIGASLLTAYGTYMLSHLIQSL